MSKIKNAFGEDRLVPGLGGRLVIDGQVVDVPDDAVFAYTQQIPTYDEDGNLLTGGWLPDDDAAQAIHEENLAAIAELLAEPEPLKVPAGNAKAEAWAAYVVAAGLATEADLVDDEGKPLTRDEIRAKFRTTNDTPEG